MDIYSLLYESLGDNDVEEYRFDISLYLLKEKLSDEKDKRIFDIICIFVRDLLYDEKKDIYESNAEIMIGENKFAFQDLTEEDYNLLSTLDFDEIPLGIKARILDVLWVCRKDYKAAGMAADAYRDLFISLFDADNWIRCFRMIKRAIMISAQIGKKQDRYRNCCQEIYDKIVLLDGTDTYWLSINLLDILCQQEYEKVFELVGIVDKIIKNSTEIHNVKKVQRAYEIKFALIKDEEERKQTNIQYASFLIKEAERVQEHNIQGVFDAIAYLEKATNIYHNIGYKEAENSAQGKLLLVQKKIPKLLVPVTVSLNPKFYEDMVKNFEGLSFKESIIRLVQYTNFPLKDDLRKDVLKGHDEYISQRLFGNNIVNGSGQIVKKIPPLDWNDPEKNEYLLEMHMHRSAFEKECYFGETYLRWGIEKINQDFQYTQENLKFLAYDNPIVPEGREKIFTVAIYLGLQGQYYEALHILAPQTENLFRNIAKLAGGITSKLKGDGTSEEKMLKKIFSMQELTDCYDENILFLFKGLLNEQAGANIRNLIAHGLMEEKEANSGIGIYFFCAIIRLLALTSKECLGILKTSEKLRNFVHTDVNNGDIVIK